MKNIRIAIYDEERDYVDMLGAFLTDFGKGKWNLSEYTDCEILLNTVKKNKIDILVATDMEILSCVQSLSGEVSLVYLSSNRGSNECWNNIFMIYRFQNAKEVGLAINKILMKENRKNNKLYMAVYSPVSRCGKTKLAYDITENEKYGRWFYLGMEDYSSAEAFTDTGEFFYYLKERNEDKLLSFIENANNKITVSQGAFELKQFEIEDMQWIRLLLNKCNYDGFIFDLGTGIMRELNLLNYFDYILVPFLQDETSVIKIENFKKNLSLYGLENIEEKLVFLNMTDAGFIKKTLDELLLTGGYE